MLRLLAIFATLCCIARAQITVTWADCSVTDGAYGQITAVAWAPLSFNPGEEVVITATASFNKIVNATSSEVEWVGGIFQDKFDSCAGATIQAPLGLATLVFPPVGCPLSGPTHTFVQRVTTSTNFPIGSTQTTFHAKDQNGAPFICMTLTLNNAAPTPAPAVGGSSGYSGGTLAGLSFLFLFVGVVIGAGIYNRYTVLRGGSRASYSEMQS